MLRKSLVLVLLVLILAGCQAMRSSDDPAPLLYNGRGPGSLTPEWSGPAILRIQAEAGSGLFSVSIRSGLDSQVLVEASGAVVEIRGYEFDSPAVFEIQGEREWEIGVFPVSLDYFKRLTIPDSYEGSGNAVIILEGKPGVAKFDTTRAKRLDAWGFGPEGVGDKLSINPEGDYQGISVLPIGTSWIIVSAEGPWSVEIQEPCCEKK